MAALNSFFKPKLHHDVILNLKVRKILTVYDFIQAKIDILVNITGLTYKEVVNYQQKIIAQYGARRKTVAELLKQQEKYVSTGIENLDSLLKNGLHGGQIYEICGKSSSGKSQLCLTIAANIAESTTGRIHYIDTNKNFSATRIQMILEKRKISDEETGRTLNQIQVTRVESDLELLNTLHSFTKSFQTDVDDKTTKLIIIDALPGIYYLSSDSAHNVKVLAALNQLANVCRFLANEFGIPIITVNLTCHWHDTDGFQITAGAGHITHKAYLGQYWSTIPNTRLFIENIASEHRKITVWKSIQLDVGSSAQVVIKDVGVL